MSGFSSRPTKLHSLYRTSPKGEKFIGRCNQCGKEGLAVQDQQDDECPNPLGVTEKDALLWAVIGDEKMTTGQKAAAESSDDRDFLPAMESVYVSDVEKLLGKKYASSQDVRDNMAEDLRKYVNRPEAKEWIIRTVVKSTVAAGSYQEALHKASRLIKLSADRIVNEGDSK